ncbi:autotransporter beta-domain protein [Chlamydia ibidis]|uniref:Autotransporter beta-domain protein n=2 Tax=Chlamydia ibidis TaxID=1405396 RepID=S7KLH2_9CHLA|nr:polymorphic outer membrane protein middle domain-containing protein [Chlamydia ibidis]EPP35255.1 autotransporter beta-domain protein [Chlamydia ibidis]EQM62901.1 autotransporter beta-domain protein [Chlamydia ibidis 10-1398/6]
MKHLSLWLLISSGITLSSFCTFANETMNLSSKDSYDGSTTTQEFTPKSTSQSATYNLTGNVSIKNAGMQDLGSGLTTSCFSTTGDLTFIGNGYSLLFDSILTKIPDQQPPAATPVPGAINVLTDSSVESHMVEAEPEATQPSFPPSGAISVLLASKQTLQEPTLTSGNLKVSGCSSFSCSYCPPEKVDLSAIGSTRGGAIKAAGGITFKDNTNIQFNYNASSDGGGAINSRVFTLEGSSISVNFSNNSSAKSGGAIFCQDAPAAVISNDLNKSKEASLPKISGQVQASNNQNNTENDAHILTITGNSNVIFSGNSAGEQGGALYSHGITTIANNDSVSFINNSINTALATPKPKKATETNELSVSHSDENLSKDPIEKIEKAEHVEKENSAHPIPSVLESVHIKALTSQKSAPLAKQAPEISTGCGGAIYSCTTSGTVSLENNGEITFSGNTSQNKGGAICTKNLVIVSGGKTTFINNSATATASPKGGAISIADGGDCSLTADSGDIIFKGNTTIQTGSQKTKSQGTPTTTKNSIDLGAGAKISKLNAKEGYGIYFYDPITSTSNSATSTSNLLALVQDGSNGNTLNINDTSNGAVYTGAIIFSGDGQSSDSQVQTLAIQEIAPENTNLKSTINQPVALKAGSLVLEKGVVVEVTSFTQESGSRLVMDLGTTLQTPTAPSVVAASNLIAETNKIMMSSPGAAAVTGTGSASANANITVTDLDINVGSLLYSTGSSKTTRTPAVIKAQGTSATATVNQVHLVDTTGNSYESLLFGSNQTFPDVVTIQSGTGGVSGFILADNQVSSQNASGHYGYQGKWTVTLAPATEELRVTNGTKKVQIAWEPSGYIASPERQGSLVPNTLWGSFADIRGIQNAIHTAIDGSQYKRGFWASGLGNFLHRSAVSESRRNFRHMSGGYALGVLGENSYGDVLSLAFCQLFAKDKDYLVSNAHATIYSGSLYYQYATSYNFWEKFSRSIFCIATPLYLHGQVTYCHTSNDMKTKLTSKYAPIGVTYSPTQGNWGNDSVGMELGGRTIFNLCDEWLFDSVEPFINLQIFYGHQGDFKENNKADGRSFRSSHLANVALPVGIKFSRLSDDDPAVYNVTIAYSPDIIRNNPHSTAVLLNNPKVAVWEVPATNLARQAFIISGGNHYACSRKMEMFSQFRFELRGSSKTYNVQVGSKLQF